MKKSTLSMMAGVTGILTGMGLASYAMNNSNTNKTMKKVKNIAEDVADDAKDMAKDAKDLASDMFGSNSKNSCH